MAPRIVVIGAGVAGLAAARFLDDRGHVVRVVDKGRSVGGRLATRRIGDATIDHGAQFFTVRDRWFAAMVEEASAAGVVYEWCRGFGGEGGGHSRYAAHGGMNRLGKYLAEGLDVVVDTQVESVTARSGGWELRHAGGQMEADALVLSAPVPQSLALLDAGGTEIESGLRSRLSAITYHPTLALLVTLDGPSAVPDPGGLQLTEGPFGFIADNHAKGISAAHAVTLHATPGLSAERWDDEPAVVQAELLEHARPWLGAATVLEAQLKRWRFAQPKEPADHRFEATVVNGAPVVFAGDAFAGARVEGAFVSGRAAAEHLHSLRPRADTAARDTA